MSPLMNTVLMSLVIVMVFGLGICLNYDPLRSRRLRWRVGICAGAMSLLGLINVQDMRLALDQSLKNVSFIRVAAPGVAVGIVVGIIAGLFSARPAAGRPAGRIEIAIWHCVMICAEQSMGIAVVFSIVALGFLAAGFGFARSGFWLTAAMAALLAIVAVGVGYIQTVLARGELAASVRLGPLQIGVPCDRQAEIDPRCGPWPEPGQWSAWWAHLASDLGLRSPARVRRSH